MHSPSSLDTQRQYHHCKEAWIEESTQAVTDLHQTLLTSKVDFTRIFIQAATIRKKVAVKLKHNDGNFGELRSTTKSVVEDFFYSLGSPVTESWVSTKQAVANSIEKMQILALDGDYKRSTDTPKTLIQSHYHHTIISHAYDIPSKLMCQIIKRDDLYMRYKKHQIPLGSGKHLSISSAILISQPVYIENSRYGEQTQLHETEAYSLYKADPTNKVVAIAKLINQNPQQVDGILSMCSGLMPRSEQSEMISRIKEELLPSVTSPEAPYRLIGQEAVALDLTSYQSLITSLAKGLKQPRLSSDCLIRLTQMSNYNDNYRIVTLQPILNANKDNGQQPITGQLLTAQYLNGELLSANFKAPQLTSEARKEYWKYASYCFNTLISANAFDVEAFMLHSAKLMHTMAHFIPVERGNAGIMQWILNAVAKYQFITLPAFSNHEISWDFKAISSTEDEFSNWWRNEAFITYPRATEISLTDHGKEVLKLLTN